MTVTLTSPVLGLAVGAEYTGNLEQWLVVEGYAKASASSAYADTFTVDPGNDNPTDYTGDVTVDGFNTLDAGGKAQGLLPADDPRLPENRGDKAEWPAGETSWSIANDAEHLNDAEGPWDGFDFDKGGVDDDAPSLASIEPAEGAAAGGTAFTLTGTSLTGVTGVTFDGVAATSVVVVSDTEVTGVTPAGTAGPADVVATDPVGSDTLAGGFTYTA